MSVLKSNIVRINGDFLELRYSLLSLLLWEYSLHLPHWFQTEALKTDTFTAVFLVVNCTTLWPEFIFVLLCLANSLSCQTETQMYSVWKMSKSLYYRCAITLFVLYNNIIPERKTAASLTATLRFVIAPPDIYSPTLELWHRVVFQGRALNRRLMWPHLCDDEGRKSQSVSSPLIWPSVSESLDHRCVSERRLL